MQNSLFSDSPSIHNFTDLISDATDTETACARLEDYLRQFQCTLLSVKFCDSRDELPAVRSFGNYPCEIKALSEKLRDTGGCPMTKEAIRLLRPFDALDIQPSRYSDFLSRRFLQELKKTGHRHIAVIPVSMNRGIALYSIGLRDRRFEGELHEFLVSTISQVTVLLLKQFPELSKLFVPNVLNFIQSRCLMLHSNGAHENQIAEIMGLSEMTIHAILNSCVKKLEVKNRAQASVKAIQLGEFVNVL